MPPLSRENILPRVITIISDVVGIRTKDITEQDLIADDLGADSLDYTEIGMMCEDEFKVEIADHDMQEVCTVRELVDLILAANPEVSLA